MPGNRKKEARKSDSRCSALAGQCPCLHVTLVAMTAATERIFEILPHPPYSPDMAASDFYLFPNLNTHLRGTQYRSNEGIIEAVNEYLGQQEKAFCFEGEGIRKLEQRWAKCILLKLNGQIFIPWLLSK